MYQPCSTLSRPLLTPQHDSRDAHQKQRDARDVEQYFFKAEEVELMELHHDKVHFPPATFVFKNLPGLSIQNDLGSIRIIESNPNGLLGPVFLSRSVLLR